ncbi:hypothetical protein FEM48_Zijuj09G0213700 [Ziziphus jujuba var. spinosa]|uniref:DC1 domain-containing protein n=1 Tax=Ziziphus jujuba var. spinosa TaxID=714518 RepID=A0A978UVD7_ZIZJJ|nr:hypothetical protein FEM48_Zijuj09G0213700 [Ziziphus jujuba var. spinosa]
MIRNLLRKLWKVSIGKHRVYIRPPFSFPSISSSSPYEEGTLVQCPSQGVQDRLRPSLLRVRSLQPGCRMKLSRKPTLKHDLHEHPLAHSNEIGLPDHSTTLCAACNNPCNKDLFRCFPCNFNIHSPLCPCEDDGLS